MSIYKIILCALSGLVFTVLMKNIRQEYALFTSLIVNIALMSSAVMFLKPVLEYISSLETHSQMQGTLIGMLFKCTGIALLCSFGAELSRDCGQGSLGAKIELFGKCGMLCYCLPLIKQVFEYALSFID